MDSKKAMTTLVLLAAVIVVCALFSRSLLNRETLADYAASAGKADTPNTMKTQVDTVNKKSSEDPKKEAFAPSPTPVPTPEPTATPEPTQAPPDIEGSFTISPLSDDIKQRITGISYPEDDSNIAISYDDLRYLTVLYYDFDDNVQTGELICNAYIAQDLSDIFKELFKNGYQIEKIRLVDEYNGDDDLSMLDNNTSCFNYRLVDGTRSLSKHALGCAIDVNPFYNPYVRPGYNPDGTDKITPPGSESFADRSLDFKHKIDKNDLCYKLFKEHGFTWGGDWSSSKDYQHFQKVP